MERAQFFAIAALASRAAFARPGYDDGQHANEQAFCALTESGCLSCLAPHRTAAAHRVKSKCWLKKEGFAAGAEYSAGTMSGVVRRG